MDLRNIFLGLQKRMIASLECQSDTIRHPGAQGAASEMQWLTMLQTYLPQRYSADSAFVLDCGGQISDQIDIVIYDRHYCPFLFHEGGSKYVPAESVYAVFEVKNYAQAREATYAGKKAASVRRLRRTSASIPHAGGVYAPKEPPRILAGLLSLDSGQGHTFREAFTRALYAMDYDAQLDLGCALEKGAFHVEYPEGAAPLAHFGEPETALIDFFLRLLAGLQASGTVAAVDFEQYRKVL